MRDSPIRLSILLAAGLSGLIVLLAAFAFRGAAVSWHGWIALIAGILLTVGLAVALMLLTFYSSRSGHDQRAHEAQQDLDDDPDGETW